LLLFFIFAKTDISLNKSNNKLAKFATISFWGFFIFSLTGPRVSSSYLLYFWFLRALVIKSNELRL